METTIGRRAFRAVLAAGAAFALIIAMPGPALAKTTSTSFVYGPDSSNWYWKDQIEQTVGAGPVAQIVTLGNPQAADTLPIAVQNGQPNKISALQFDLLQRGVIAGSTLTKFALSIAENDDLLAGFQDLTQPDLQPSFNTNSKLIQACAITSVWSAGEGAELWDRAPSYDDAQCVQGKRVESGNDVTWSFDLTTMAAEWATDLSTNRGVMLVPVIPDEVATLDSTWQINLKLPHRDDDSTPSQDEYDQTKTRVDVDVAFTAPAGTQGGDSFTGGGSNFLPTGGTGSPGSDFPFGSQPVTTGGSTSTPTAQERTSTSRPSPTVPRLPWYVWVLIPLGLVAVSTVRAVVLEPLATGKPGGVIAAIRTKNAELRGMGSRGTAAALRRNGPRFAALMSIGSLGRQGWESVASMASRARRSLRRR